MDQSKNIIKRVYDEYSPSDYILNTDSSTNLNPQREIPFDQLEIIRQRLQVVTDDIVRRRIARVEEPELPARVSVTPGSTSPKNSPLRQAAQISTGTIGLGVLFPVIDGPNGGLQHLLEPLIGSFPSELILGELDKPLALDCKEILKQYDFPEDDSNEKDEEDPDSESGSDISPEDSDEEGDEEEDNPSEDDNGEDEDDEGEIDEFEACAMIEMVWLKIILIILRIIKILQILMDLILAILVPLLEIVMLALICWIVPPAAEQLRQRITEMVIAIIIMIITRLIQMIWGLLNLDCLTDMTMDLIAQIRTAMSMFYSLMSVFNVKAVNMTIGNTLDQLADPMDKIAELASNHRDEMDKLLKGFSDEFGSLSVADMWKKSVDQIKSGVVNGVSSDPNVQKMNETIKAAQNLVKNDITAILSTINKTKKAATKSNPKPEPGKADEESMMKASGMESMF